MTTPCMMPLPNTRGAAMSGKLKNVLVYALYSLGDDQSVLTVQHLPPRFMRELEASVVAGTIPDTEDSHQDSQNFSEASARAERKVLWEALVNSRYNKVLAARTLAYFPEQAVPQAPGTWPARQV